MSACGDGNFHFTDDDTKAISEKFGYIVYFDCRIAY